MSSRAAHVPALEGGERNRRSALLLLGGAYVTTCADDQDFGIDGGDGVKLHGHVPAMRSKDSCAWVPEGGDLCVPGVRGNGRGRQVELTDIFGSLRSIPSP